jgi:hypothetical protein
MCWRRGAVKKNERLPFAKVPENLNWTPRADIEMAFGINESESCTLLGNATIIQTPLDYTLTQTAHYGVIWIVCDLVRSASNCATGRVDGLH